MGESLGRTDECPCQGDAVAKLIEQTFDAGRCSGLEEAATIAEAEHNRDRDDDDWAAGYRTACIYLVETLRALIAEGK